METTTRGFPLFATLSRMLTLPAWRRETLRLNEIAARVDISIQSSEELSEKFERIVEDNHFHKMLRYDHQYNVGHRGE